MPVNDARFVEIAADLMVRHSVQSVIIHGSRVLGEELPGSDLDVFAVSTGIHEFEERRIADCVSGMPGNVAVDLRVTTPRGAKWAHVMSPEWRHAFFGGRRYGEWKWLPVGLPLSRQGAHDYFGDLKVQLSVAIDWGGTHEETVTDLIRVFRREVILEAALGISSGVPDPGSWAHLARVIGAEQETIDGVRLKRRESFGRIEPSRLVETIRERMVATGSALERYAENEADRQLALLLSEEAAASVG